MCVIVRYLGYLGYLVVWLLGLFPRPDVVEKLLEVLRLALVICRFIFILNSALYPFCCAVEEVVRILFHRWGGILSWPFC
jgi:hypothetical protein